MSFYFIKMMFIKILLNLTYRIFDFLYGTEYCAFHNVKNKRFVKFPKFIKYIPYPLSQLFINVVYFRIPYLYKHNDKIHYSKLCSRDINLLPPVISIRTNTNINVRNQLLSFHSNTPLFIVLMYYKIDCDKLIIKKFDKKIKINVNKNKSRSIYDIIKN
jgi:hypothetical protein